MLVHACVCGHYISIAGYVVVKVMISPPYFQVVNVVKKQEAVNALMGEIDKNHTLLNAVWEAFDTERELDIAIVRIIISQSMNIFML